MARMEVPSFRLALPSQGPESNLPVDVRISYRDET